MGSKDTSSKEDDGYLEMPHEKVRHFEHHCIPCFPKQLQRDTNICCALPVPVFNPHKVSKYPEIFTLRSGQLDYNLSYYKKLHFSNPKKVLKKTIDESTVTNLPQYVVDVATGMFESLEDSFYTNGTLDYFQLNNQKYLVWADLEGVRLSDIHNEHTDIKILKCEDDIIYNVQAVVFNGKPIVAVRNKDQLSIHKIKMKKLNSRTLWKLKTPRTTFVDFALDSFNCNQIAYIDNKHKLKFVDFIADKTLLIHEFEKDLNASDDFSQIKYLDQDTLIYMNRASSYLLDLRSFTSKKYEMTKSFDCDELCTFSSDLNYMYMSSIHNTFLFDIRSSKFVTKVSHLMSSVPFTSCLQKSSSANYLCLLGRNVRDKVILCNSSNSLGIPRVIPNPTDTLLQTALQKRMNNFYHIEERLSAPTLGIKCIEDNKSDTVTLYTANSIGDVFKQRILLSPSGNDEAIDSFIDWSCKIEIEPKPLQATNICNLDKLMLSITGTLPNEAKLKRLMGNDKLLSDFLANESKSIETFLEHPMGALWIDGEIIKTPYGEDEERVLTGDIDNTEETAKRKVSEWLEVAHEN